MTAPTNPIATSRTEHDALSRRIFMAEMGNAVVMAPAMHEGGCCDASNNAAEQADESASQVA